MENNDLRTTGLWPFSLFKGGAFGGEPQATGNVVGIFDPVALAWNAGGKLIEAGWVGLELMDRDFLWKIADANQEDVGALALEWTRSHQSAIAEAFEQRLASYAIDESAKEASRQALFSYRADHFISTVRTLMPEVEKHGRIISHANGAASPNMKQAVQAIQDYLGQMELSHFDPIESLTVHKIVEEDLFAKCFNQSDARNLEEGLNRHAELHGLGSYGDLRGATKMLCVQDFLLHSVSAASGTSNPDK
ncbi:MAG: hypothetical protein P4L91_09520 [Burkholderiaceae bacterium]|nr:hypothetical protein [Burkholderiaceae bacterium]